MNFKRSLVICLAGFSPMGHAADAASVGTIGSVITGPAEGAHAADIATPKPAMEALGSSVPIQTQISPAQGLGLSAEMAKMRFVLKEIRVMGAEILTCEALVEPFRDLYDQNISLAQAQGIAQQMSTRFQKEGYILTQVIIPPQHIQNGVLTLQVIGGFVDKLEISGCTNPELIALLESYAHRIRSSHPLHVKVMERYLLLANDIPGLSVKAVLTPSKNVPGAGDLKLVTTQKFKQGFFEVNNFGSRFLGPTQFLFDTKVNSVFQPGDATELFYMTTANKALNYFQWSHSEMIKEEGARWHVFARYLPTHPGFMLKPLHIMGKYKVGGLDLSYPVIRSIKENFLITGSFHVIDSSSSVLRTPLFQDRIRPFFMSFLYNHWDDKGVNQAELVFHQTFKWMKASGTSTISRPRGKSAYTKLNLTLSRDHKLGQNFSLLALVVSQLSFQPLLAIAQLPFGGNYVGRGYDPAEILGDSGMLGTLELRYNGPDRACFTPQYYAFYDVGVLWNRYETSGFLHESATSGGVGLRLRTKADIDLNLYVAKPLTRVVAAFNNRHPRYYCSFHYHF